MKHTLWICVLSLFVGIGCGGNEEEAQAEAEAAVSELEAALNMAADEATMAAETAGEAGGEAGEAAGAAGMGLGELGAALGQALEASAMAEGGTPCEQAYNGAMAMVQALQKQMGEGQGNMPDRDTFMEACNQLPENAQQCMVPAYAMGHMQECQEVQRSPEVQRVRELMRGSANMDG